MSLAQIQTHCTETRLHINTLKNLIIESQKLFSELHLVHTDILAVTLDVLHFPLRIRSTLSTEHPRLSENELQSNHNHKGCKRELPEISPKQSTLGAEQHHNSKQDSEKRTGAVVVRKEIQKTRNYNEQSPPSRKEKINRNNSQHTENPSKSGQHEADSNQNLNSLFHIINK